MKKIFEFCGRALVIAFVLAMAIALVPVAAAFIYYVVIAAIWFTALCGVVYFVGLLFGVGRPQLNNNEHDQEE